MIKEIILPEAKTIYRKGRNLLFSVPQKYHKYEISLPPKMVISPQKVKKKKRRSLPKAKRRGKSLQISLPQRKLIYYL